MSRASLFRAWLKDDRGTSGVEFMLLFPIAFALLLATADIGEALWLQRKLLSATQSVGDLLAREEALNAAKVDSAVLGAELILQPFERSGLAYDVMGIRFDPNHGRPAVSWRKTRNMTPDGRFPTIATGLGARGEGVIGVVMTYTFRARFAGGLIGDIDMVETAILRGRKVPLIPYT